MKQEARGKAEQRGRRGIEGKQVNKRALSAVEEGGCGSRTGRGRPRCCKRREGIKVELRLRVHIQQEKHCLKSVISTLVHHCYGHNLPWIAEIIHNQICQ